MIEGVVLYLVYGTLFTFQNILTGVIFFILYRQYWNQRPSGICVSCRRVHHVSSLAPINSRVANQGVAKSVNGINGVVGQTVNSQNQLAVPLGSGVGGLMNYDVRGASSQTMDLSQIGSMNGLDMGGGVEGVVSRLLDSPSLQSMDPALKGVIGSAGSLADQLGKSIQDGSAGNALASLFSSVITGVQGNTGLNTPGHGQEVLSSVELILNKEE